MPRRAWSSDPMLPVGSNYCKCGACGEYFGGANAFAKHRIKNAGGGLCVPPSDVRNRKNELVLELNSKGYWVRYYS